MTVGYENSKFKRNLDSKDPSPLLPNDKASLKLKSKNSLAAKRNVESDPLLVGFDEIEKRELEKKSETQKRVKLTKTSTIYDYNDKNNKVVSSQEFLD